MIGLAMSWFGLFSLLSLTRGQEATEIQNIKGPMTTQTGTVEVRQNQAAGRQGYGPWAV